MYKLLSVRPGNFAADKHIYKEKIKRMESLYTSMVIWLAYNKN